MFVYINTSLFCLSVIQPSNSTWRSQWVCSKCVYSSHSFWGEGRGVISTSAYLLFNVSSEVTRLFLEVLLILLNTPVSYTGDLRCPASLPIYISEECKKIGRHPDILWQDKLGLVCVRDRSWLRLLVRQAQVIQLVPDALCSSAMGAVLSRGALKLTARSKTSDELIRELFSIQMSSSRNLLYSSEDRINGSRA